MKRRKAGEIERKESDIVPRSPVASYPPPAVSMSSKPEEVRCKRAIIDYEGKRRLNVAMFLEEASRPEFFLPVMEQWKALCLHDDPEISLAAIRMLMEYLSPAKGSVELLEDGDSYGPATVRFALEAKINRGEDAS